MLLCGALLSLGHIVVNIHSIPGVSNVVGVGVEDILAVTGVPSVFNTSCCC